MPEELLTNMTFSPAMIAVGLGIGILFFLIGWISKGIGAGRRETDLKRDVLEAKASVPQLESTVRNRDQQITRLQEELGELNEQTAELLRAQDGKERELRTAERAVKNLNSELNAVKGNRGDANTIIMDGFDDEATGEQDSDPTANSQLSKLEKLYEKLKGALIKRDERIEELEALLTGVQSASPAEQDILQEAAPEPPSGQVRELEDRIKSQDRTISTLRSEISTIKQDKDMLEELANKRSKSNRALKDATIEAEARVPQLEKDIEAREGTIADREASIKRLLGEQDALKGELTEQGRIVESHKADAVAKTELLESTQQKIVALETGIEQREQQLTAFDSELATTRAAIETLTAEKTTAETGLARLESQSAGLNEQLRSLGQAQTTLEGSIRDRDFKIEALSGEVDQLKRALDRTSQEAEDALTISEKRQQVASSEITEAEQHIAAQRREIEDLKSSLGQREQWMEKLKASLGEREARSEELKQRISELTGDIDGANQQLKNQHEARQNIEAEKHESESLIASNRARAEQAEAELVEQQQSIAVYQSMLADRDFKIEALNQDLELLRASPSPDDNPDADAAAADGSTAGTTDNPQVLPDPASTTADEASADEVPAEAASADEAARQAAS